MTDDFRCTVEFSVDGHQHSVTTDVRTTLLDLLREQLHVTGPKKGCDHGLCGACTVTVNGERVLACLTLAVTVTGCTVGTVAGLAIGDELTPLQRAFVDNDGFQCGYCTPGQLTSAAAMLREHARGDLSLASFEAGQICRRPCLSRNEIRERMAGNICRCGAQANIVDAIHEVAER